MIWTKRLFTLSWSDVLTFRCVRICCVFEKKYKNKIKRSTFNRFSFWWCWCDAFRHEAKSNESSSHIETKLYLSFFGWGMRIQMQAHTSSQTILNKTNRTYRTHTHTYTHKSHRNSTFSVWRKCEKVNLLFGDFQSEIFSWLVQSQIRSNKRINSIICI